MAILPLLSESDPVTQQSADAAGDEFRNEDGDTKLIAYNQTGAALRLVFAEQRACSYGLVQHADSTVTIAAGDNVPVGKFNPHRFNNSFRRVEVTYPDGVVGLFVASASRP